MKTKKWLSLLLAALMLAAVLPMSGALAAGADATYVKVTATDGAKTYSVADGAATETGSKLDAGRCVDFLAEEQAIIGEDTTPTDLYKVKAGSDTVYLKKADGEKKEVYLPTIAFTGSGEYCYDGAEASVSAAIGENGTPLNDFRYTVTVDDVKLTAADAAAATAFIGGVSRKEVGETTFSIKGVHKENSAITVEQSGKLTVLATAIQASDLSADFDGNDHQLAAAKVMAGGSDVTGSFEIRYYEKEADSENSALGSSTPPKYKEEGTYPVYITAFSLFDPEIKIKSSAKVVIGGMPTLKVDAVVAEMDGTEHTLTATVENGAGYTVLYSTDDGATWSTNAPSRKEVGTTNVKIKATHDTKAMLTATSSITVNKATAKMTVTGGTVAYNGQARTFSISFAGIEKPLEEYTFQATVDNGKTWIDPVIKYHESAMTYYPSASGTAITNKGKLTIKIKATNKADNALVLESSATLEITADTKAVLTIVNVNNSCNVREAASSSSTKLGTAKKGNKYDLLGVEGDWYKIQYTADKVGYIFKDYGKSSEEIKPVETPAGANQVATVVNCQNSVNVRKGPGTTYGIFSRSAAKGSKYKLLATVATGTATWYKVQFGSEIGYIHGSYISVSTETTPPPTGQIVTIVNVNNSCNVREGAGTNYKKLGEAKKNAVYKYLGTSGDWYKIQYTATQEAYIHKNYGALSSGSAPTPTPETQTQEKLTIINCNSEVNVRAGASTGTTKLGTAKKGSTYQCLGKTGDWYKIQYTADLVGYVFHKYGQITGTTTPTYSTKTGWGYVANVNTSANVREEARSSSTLVGTALKNYVYKVLGKEGEWYKIQYGSKEAWINDSYFKHCVSEDKSVTIVNCAESVNVRNAALTNAAKLGTAKLGESYTFLYNRDKFVAIMYNGRIGFILQTYASIG